MAIVFSALDKDGRSIAGRDGDGIPISFISRTGSDTDGKQGK